jgi:hypothetical protein
VLGALLAVAECADLVALFYALVASDIIGPAGVEVKATLSVFAWREVAMLLSSLALVCIGILLKLRLRGARVAAMVWCEVALGILVGRAVLWSAYLWPHLDRAIQLANGTWKGTGLDFFSDLFFGILGALGEVTEYVLVLVLAVYPLVMLPIVARRKFGESLVR